jgi:hypothetical protein
MAARINDVAVADLPPDVRSMWRVQTIVLEIRDVVPFGIKQARHLMKF